MRQQTNKNSLFLLKNKEIFVVRDEETKYFKKAYKLYDVFCLQRQSFNKASVCEYLYLQLTSGKLTK